MRGLRAHHVAHWKVRLVSVHLLNLDTFFAACTALPAGSGLLGEACWGSSNLPGMVNVELTTRNVHDLWLYSEYNGNGIGLAR
jgi:hypothetical protein